MAEYTSAAVQTVAAGQNVLLTETVVAGKPCIVHRAGSGIVTLRGLTNQCKARFKISFGANIAIPTGGTVEAISASLAINGEPLNSATATVTPAAEPVLQFLQYLHCCICRGSSWMLRNNSGGK